MTARTIFEIRRPLVALVLAMALALALALTSVGTAFADAGGSASCMGHEASGVSPPGSSEEFPAGMRALRNFVDAAFPGVPPGAIFSTIAKLHAGSHEACDEALG